MIKNNPQTNVTRERYASLDGLRAYAAIGIVMMHVLANINIKPQFYFFSDKIIPWFTDFTLLFMTISAFSMCCGYYDKIKNGKITPSQFFTKRYQRIWPFFAVMVCIDFALEPSVSTFRQVFANLTLCFNLLPNPEIHVIGVGWFLGIIFTFYLLFPFFVFLINSKKKAWIILLLSIAFSYISIVQFNGTTSIFNRANIINSAPFFIAGGIVYLHREKLKSVCSKFSWLLLVFCIILNISLFLIPNDNLFVLADLIVFSAWLIYAISSNKLWLNNVITKHLSKISMEIYLCHMMFYRVTTLFHLEKYIHQANLLYIVTVITTLFGAICFSHAINLGISLYINRKQRMAQ